MLTKWAKTNKRLVRDLPDYPGVRVVAITAGESGYRDLWNLSDYRVSSVCAGSVYLIRK